MDSFDNLVDPICRQFAKNNIRIEWEDLAQECRVRIFTKWDIISKSRNITAVIKQTCRNCCRNAIRDTDRQMPQSVLSTDTPKTITMTSREY
jgi:DNA-directed RNA polymerase specialized sigma24 family protein